MAHNICGLPDVVLLHILKYLPSGDLINISQTCRRLNILCRDRTVISNLEVEGQYFVKEDDLKDLVQNGHPYIKRLNLDHCYWFNQRVISWVISKCKNLVSLRVIECKLKTEALVKVISSCTKLTELAFSINSFANIKKDVFAPAKRTLKKVERLDVYYTSREMALVNYFGEHATVLDFCEGLKELYIGSAGMAIPELYRPIISRPQQLSCLEVMSITSNIHAGAQMMFYGTLSQLPNASISWRTLLMPNVNLLEFVTKHEFRGCLSNMGTIEHLDVSGSKVMFPCEYLDITTATKLTHLNISMTLVNSDQLKIIATNCNKLNSINLFGCGHIFQGREGLDFSGLETLFERCPDLEQLNLAGAHHHLFMLPEGDLGVIRHVFSKMRGLKSLSLPMCMLADTGQTQGRSGKRLASSSPKSHPHQTKRRCLELGNSQCSDGSPDHDGSPSTSSCSSPTRGGCSFPLAPHVTVLHELLQDNPDIEELELLAVNFHSAIHKNKYVNPKAQQFGPCLETRRVRDVAIEPVSQLKQLRRLVIVGAPGLMSGQCLVTISHNCRLLRHLQVGYLGGVMYGHIFAQALVNLKNLQDLRLEQPHMCLNAALFEGLCHCESLSRICIIAKHSTFNIADVVKLVEQLSRLVVVQVFAGGTITACKNLVSTLHKRLIKQRPGLSTAIYPLLYDGISETTKSIPPKHFDDLTRFQSRVGFQSPLK